MLQESTFIRESFPVGMLACNCSIIGDALTSKAMVIDPGGDADLILERVKQLDLTVVALIVTHGHFDHFLAAGELHKATGAPIHLHKDDEMLWKYLEVQCQMFGAEYKPVPAPHHWIKDEEVLPCCNGQALHTPGHSPGSVSFWFEAPNVLIAGDTLFKGSIGRTDILGGDFNKIEKSIRERLYTLNNDALVITGHGKYTTIGEEKEFNNILRA